MQTIIYILPELFLSLAIMSILMVGVFIKKSFKLVNLLTILISPVSKRDWIAKIQGLLATAETIEMPASCP